jgi:hypothetical protein
LKDQGSHWLDGAWRRVEPGTKPIESEARAIVTMTSTDLIGELRELIAALDRRVPRVARAGELEIAGDAAVLKTRAMQRIEALERELALIGSE